MSDAQKPPGAPASQCLDMKLRRGATLSAGGAAPLGHALASAFAPGLVLGMLLLPSSTRAEPSPPPRAPTAAASGITAEILSLRNDRGKVFCSLYSSEDGFPMQGNKAFRRTETKPKDGKATCAFPDVPVGTYAIGLLHDENDNGKMDTNFIGMPKEGYGASNDAKGTLGPPKFKDAKVEFKGGVLTLKINARYVL